MYFFFDNSKWSKAQTLKVRRATQVQYSQVKQISNIKSKKHPVIVNITLALLGFPFTSAKCKRMPNECTPCHDKPTTRTINSKINSKPTKHLGINSGMPEQLKKARQTTKTKKKNYATTRPLNMPQKTHGRNTTPPKNPQIQHTNSSPPKQTKATKLHLLFFVGCPLFLGR